MGFARYATSISGRTMKVGERNCPLHMVIDRDKRTRAPEMARKSVTEEIERKYAGSRCPYAPIS